MSLSISPDSDILLPAKEILDNQGRATATVVLLFVAMALAAVSSLFGILQLFLLSAVDNGVRLPETLVSVHLALFGLVETFQSLIYLITAVPFIMWFRRAYENLSRLGVRRLEHSPGWAVGAWFVPVMSLFYPYEMGGEIWSESARLGSGGFNGSEGGLFGAGRSSATDRTVGLWWLCFLAMNFLTMFGAIVGKAANGMSGAMTGTGLALTGDLAAVGAAVAAIRIIRRVQGWQISADSRRQETQRPVLDSE